MYNERLLNRNSSFRRFRKDRIKKYKTLELPKWKRIRLKNFSIPDFKDYNNLKIHKPENTKILDILSTTEDINEYNKYIDIDNEFGVDEKFVSLTEAFYNSGVIIKANKKEKIKEAIKLDYEMDKTNPILLDQNLIIAEKDSEVTVVIDYNSKSKSFHSGVTKVYAKEGALVNVIKVQRMDEDSNNFDSNIAFVEGYGKVNWISVELGCNITASSFITNLKQDNSNADLNSIYFGDNDMGLDLEYTMNHYGRRSLSNIQTKGALKDKSKKVFRGNLDFKKGSSRSKGEEEEFVLLLDKTVKSDAIPALLCSEDDVEGEHAASAGQINDLKLFYLMSRGMTETQAKKMIIEASFRPIIDKIPFKDLRESIEKDIHRRLIDE